MPVTKSLHLVSETNRNGDVVDVRAGGAGADQRTRSVERMMAVVSGKGGRRVEARLPDHACGPGCHQRSGGIGRTVHTIGREREHDRIRDRLDLEGGREDVGVVGRQVVAAEVQQLYRARSRLYRNEILQGNMRLKALAEIYTMHSFALL